MQLSFDLIETWLEEHPEVLGLKKNEESVFRKLALFQDYYGLPAFKDVSNINYVSIYLSTRPNYDTKYYMLLCNRPWPNSWEKSEGTK